MKCRINFKLNDILHTNLPHQEFDRILIESVLIMLPKADTLHILHDLLDPNGLLVINEAMYISANIQMLSLVENEFQKYQINWSLLSQEAWMQLFSSTDFKVIENTPPTLYSVARMGFLGFLRHPFQSISFEFKVLFNAEARAFFKNITKFMEKARIRWGYCIWLCKAAL